MLTDSQSSNPGIPCRTILHHTIYIDVQMSLAAQEVVSSGEGGGRGGIFIVLCCINIDLNDFLIFYLHITFMFSHRVILLSSFHINILCILQTEQALMGRRQCRRPAGWHTPVGSIEGKPCVGV